MQYERGYFQNVGDHVRIVSVIRGPECDASPFLPVSILNIVTRFQGGVMILLVDFLGLLQEVRYSCTNNRRRKGLI